MTVSIKGLIAGLVTVAAIGTAFAQSTPPKPAVANPATGAGQQSSQKTPMGETGTPGGAGMATSGATMAAPAATTTAPAAPMASSGTGSTGTTMASNTRRTRADRN